MEKEGKGLHPECAFCQPKAGYKLCMENGGVGAKGCPTLTQTSVLDASNKLYEDPKVLNFAQQASRQEAACYANRHERPYVMQPTKTRIVEICEFAKTMQYQKLGLAFCIGLAKEAFVVAEIFKIHNFDLVSVACKAGRTPKEKIGLGDEDKIYQGTDEAMCNPIYQAELMNREKTDLNILLGLCVGHDSLFLEYAESPVTVLAVKDRVTGHNPLAAIYLSDSYYRKIKPR